jgi:hypothetical protein
VLLDPWTAPRPFFRSLCSYFIAMDDNDESSSDQNSVSSFNNDAVFHSNKNTITLEADLELLQHLISPQRSSLFWSRSCKKQAILFGSPNTLERKRSRNRHTYLRNLQAEQPSVFLGLCEAHGLVKPKNIKVEKQDKQKATALLSPSAEAMSARKSRQSLLPAYYGKYINSDFSY